MLAQGPGCIAPQFGNSNTIMMKKYDHHPPLLFHWYSCRRYRVLGSPSRVSQEVDHEQVTRNGDISIHQGSPFHSHAVVSTFFDRKGK